MAKWFLSICVMVGALSLQAQDIILPPVNYNQKSLSVMEALASRHSVREYGNQVLTEQELGNLCWAACGKSRDEEHRTYPSAMNRKEIRLFVFTTTDVYEYLPVGHSLKWITKGDYRKLIASNGGGFSQDFVLSAPVSLIMIIDFELMGSQDERSLMMGCVDAGNVSENINLYCQAVGLATVPRATMDVESIRQVLKLSEKQLPIMNNPVGYPAK